MSSRELLPLVLLCGLVGCAEDIARPGHNDAVVPPPRTAHPGASAQAGEEEGPPAVEFQEADFAETERSRDPFRSFAKLFSEQAKSRIKSQRDVVLEQYSVDELRLIGIVTRIEPAKAMMVDPTGKGHVISRGQFIGRPEIVQGGSSGADYEINWRVQRIRDSDIVLVREDPANPDVPSATRVIPLRPEDTG